MVPNNALPQHGHTPLRTTQWWDLDGALALQAITTDTAIVSKQPHQGIAPGLVHQSSEDGERLLYE